MHCTNVISVFIIALLIVCTYLLTSTQRHSWYSFDWEVIDMSSWQVSISIIEDTIDDEFLCHLEVPCTRHSVKLHWQILHCCLSNIYAEAFCGENAGRFIANDESIPPNSNKERNPMCMINTSPDHKSKRMASVSHHLKLRSLLEKNSVQTCILLWEQVNFH